MQRCLKSPLERAVNVPCLLETISPFDRRSALQKMKNDRKREIIITAYTWTGLVYPPPQTSQDLNVRQPHTTTRVRRVSPSSPSAPSKSRQQVSEKGLNYHQHVKNNIITLPHSMIGPTQWQHIIPAKGFVAQSSSHYRFPVQRS